MIVSVIGAAAACAIAVALRANLVSTCPEGAALVRLYAIGAAVLLPLALALCTATVLTAQHHLAYGLGEYGSRRVAWLLHTVVAIFAARITWVAIRLALASRRARVRDGVARLLLPLPGGGTAHVLPVAQPLAYTVGILRGQVVVSRGALDALNAEERVALLAHEAAHRRAGHHRIIFLAAVLSESFPLPWLRRARRDLELACELAADRAAARATRRWATVRAIAKSALAGAPARAAAASGGDVRIRLAALEHTRVTTTGSAVVWGATAAIAAAVAVATSLTFHDVPPPLVGTAAALALATVSAPSVVAALRLRRSV